MHKSSTSVSKHNLVKREEYGIHFFIPQHLFSISCDIDIDHKHTSQVLWNWYFLDLDLLFVIDQVLYSGFPHVDDQLMSAQIDAGFRHHPGHPP